MTAECTCPRSLAKIAMIEYPGFVKNHDRALATLGGLDSIEKVFESKKDRLELKFRKADPFSHPAYGDRVPKRCLVIRITRSKTSSPNRDEQNQFSIEVIGKIQTSFRFETLAEFQWLPMQRLNEPQIIQPSDIQTGVTIEPTPESQDPTYVSVLDDVLPIKNPFDNTLKNFNPDAPLLLLPAVFSRFDTAREIHQPHPKFRSKEMREEFERQQSMSIIGRTRKKRTTMSYLLNYSDRVPESPIEKLVKEKSMLSMREQSLIPKLEECFERQKVWSKASLCYELDCSLLDIKYILPLVAFHYLTGPFRTMWVKYGYNPHEDTSSKPLQVLDFRFKQPHEQAPGYSRRSIHQYQLPMRKNPEKLRGKHQLDFKSIISNAGTSSTANQKTDLSASFDDTIAALKTGAGPNNLVVTEAMCKFRRDLVPSARQLSYQLKDIEVDEVQAIVHSNDGREPSVCAEKDGWLVEGAIDKIRKIMNKCLDEVVSSMMNQIEDIASG